MNMVNEAPPITGSTKTTMRLAHFNPGLQSKEDMRRGFIARQRLLSRMLDDLRRETGQSAPQHKLIIGQRGMGKTTLLHRFGQAVEDDAELSLLWQPLLFPEEQYNIARLSDFWLNCLDALSDALETKQRKDLADSLDHRRDALPKDEVQRSAAALALLLEQAQALDKRLMLLIDNLDIVLERLSEQDWEIRRIIAAEPRLLLVGATSRALATAYEYGRAFYDFFRIHELKGLTEQETREVLLTLSQLREQPRVATILEQAPGRILALHSLSGGNPRTVVLLYEVLESSADDDARVDLERLLDLYTPLYKARFEEFSDQSQVVIDALAVHWDPMLAGALAEVTRLPINTVSAQLNRLEQQGVVEKVALYQEKKQGFQIAERFFNIWYLMRASRRVRRRLLWLVRFIETWYDESALQQQARTHLQQQPDHQARERYADYSLALAQAVRHAPLRTALQQAALHVLVDGNDGHSSIDFGDLPPELQDKQQRMALLRQLRSQVLAASVAWPDINAEEFWRLLGGSPFLSLNEKQRIVESLTDISVEALAQLIADLRRQERKILDNYRRQQAVVHKLYEALARGDMVDVYDWEDARAFAEDPRYRLLPYIAVNVCLFFGSPNPEELNKAEAYLKAMSADSLLAAQGWQGLGNLYSEHLQRYEDAEQAYRQAIALEPQWTYPWNALGNLYSNYLHRYQEAEQAYRQVIALDAQFARPWSNLGNLLQSHLQRYEEAEQAYRQAIALDPQDAAPWFNLGILLHVHLKRYEEAEQAYWQALTIDQDYHRAKNNLLRLGNTWYNQKAYRQAENLAQRLTATFPDNAEAWLLLAQSVAGRLAIEAPTIALPQAQVVLEAVGRWLLAVAQDEEMDSGQASKAAKKLLRTLVNAGLAAALCEQLQQAGLHERWRPLYEALQAAATGTVAYLSRVAPEVRRPALDILKVIAPGLSEGSDAL